MIFVRISFSFFFFSFSFPNLPHAKWFILPVFFFLSSSSLFFSKESSPTKCHNSRLFFVRACHSVIQICVTFPVFCSRVICNTRSVPQSPFSRLCYSVRHTPHVSKFLFSPLAVADTQPPARESYRRLKGGLPEQSMQQGMCSSYLIELIQRIQS